MSKAPKDLRIPIMMSSAEVDAIDEWRFANKIATRAQAVRQLCQMGIALDAEGKKLLEMAQESTEATKRATLLRMRDLETGKFPDVNEANEALVDTITYAARMTAVLSYLVSASEEMRQFVSDDEITTYKDALRNLADQRMAREQSQNDET